MKIPTSALAPLLFLAISGCGSSDSSDGGGAGSRADQSASYAISEAEAQQFGEALEAAHENNDSAAAAALVDLSRAAEAAVADFAIKEGVKQQMSGGLVKGIYQQFGNFLGVVNQSGAEETSYQFLRTASRGRRAWLSSAWFHQQV